DGLISCRGQFMEPGLRAAGERQGGRPAGRIDNSDIAHEHAPPESGSHGLGKGLLRREALGQGAGARQWPAGGLRLLDLGEAACFEAGAPPFERIGDPLDIAEVAAHSDDHRASSISWRIFITAASSPTNTASPTK